MKDYRLVLFSRQAWMCRDLYMAANDPLDLKPEEVWSEAMALELMDDDYDEYPDMESALKEIFAEEYYLVCIVEMGAEFEWGPQGPLI
jgi:hypothetical protein